MANRSDESVNAVIGNLLRFARQSKNLTQSEMATACDISRNHLSAVERGESKASIQLLIGYCEKLDMSPNDILGISGKGNMIIPELQQLLPTLSTDDQLLLVEIGKAIWLF